MPDNSFFGELKKRKVLQSAAIYTAVAWGVVEIVVTVAEQLFLPQWIPTLTVIFFVAGFPVIMFLAWAFDVTADGIRRTDVSSRRGKASIVLSMLLLVAGTAGLFLLIRPSMQLAMPGSASGDIVPNSVAVLPFDSSSAEDADVYLSEGLSDELRDQLGRIGKLRIAARSSSIAALERGMDAIDTSTTLRVEHIVEGSLRRQGNRLRVSVQLIEGRTGLAVWSDTYERGANELLMVQQTVVEEIVRRLLPDVEYIDSGPATQNADANELMLLAQHYENQVRARSVVDTPTLLKAIGLYRQATEADPESALAHSRLAGALLYLGDLEAAEAPIFRALSLNPNLSEVQNTLGEYYVARGLPGADTAFERALQLNPHDADALHNYAYATWLSIEAHEEGTANPEEFFRRALELDPLSLARHAALGEYLGKDGYTEEVRTVIGNIQELFDSTESYAVIAWLHELIGEVDLAIAWRIRARDREPDNPDHVAKLAELYALIGDAATALQLEPDPSLGILFHLRRYDDLIDAAEIRMIDAPDDVEVRYLLGFAYTATGQYELAIHVLGSTGLPDSAFEDRARSVLEIEAFQTLMNAMAASDLPEANRLALSMAEWQEDFAWWGDIGWIALYRSCNFSILGRHEDALELLPRIRESSRLRLAPYLYDSWCFQRYADDPVYQEVLQEQERRRAELRDRLPVTLATLGLSL